MPLTGDDRDLYKQLSKLASQETRNRCVSARFEARGPGILLAGLCLTCGRSTTHRDINGMARHEQLGPDITDPPL